MSEQFFIQGNEACARGAIEAGCRFFAGYPITPSTEIAEDMALFLPKREDHSSRWKMKSQHWEQLSVQYGAARKE